MRRFQFTLRELFLMTTLIAVGIYGLVWIARHALATNTIGLDIIAIVSATLIGAGIGTPFHKVRISLAIGFVILLLIGLTMPMLFPIAFDR